MNVYIKACKHMFVSRGSDQAKTLQYCKFSKKDVSIEFTIMPKTKEIEQWSQY